MTTRPLNEWPTVTSELLECLRERFPMRRYRQLTTDLELHEQHGTQSVIEWLQSLHNLQKGDTDGTTAKPKPARRADSSVTLSLGD